MKTSTRSSAPHPTPPPRRIRARRPAARSPLADAIRQRVGTPDGLGIDLDDHERELLRVLDLAEGEVLTAMLTSGVLLSWHHGAIGLNECIERVLLESTPEHVRARDAEIVRLDAIVRSSGDPGVAPVETLVLGAGFMSTRAAYCLGLSIGHRLGGAR